jgi:hypothetical protein
MFLLWVTLLMVTPYTPSRLICGMPLVSRTIKLPLLSQTTRMMMKLMSDLLLLLLPLSLPMVCVVQVVLLRERDLK